MTNDPYSQKKITKNLYVSKSEITGYLVAVLDGQMDDRGLNLITPPSRCLRQNEIHELILTDDAEACPGRNVNKIAYFGFFLVQSGGVLVCGDAFLAGGKCIGRLAGFDETHMPNHLNIVIKVEKRVTGLEFGATLGDTISFK